LDAVRSFLLLSLARSLTDCPIIHSEHDITGVLDETFSVTEDRFGELITVDLKPGGSEIPVTEENKHQYVELAVHYRIVGRVKEQFDAFIDGFFEVVPKALITVFDERELELLIGGMTDIDMYVTHP
jgi:E3 ubiquitin-protein ligase NEDD4